MKEFNSGSSPRVRGTPAIASGLSLGMGIIPACAGNTQENCLGEVGAGDHPRVCGEHYAYDSADITGMGSSPRVRGTPINALVTSSSWGIIPACAGNTVFCVRYYIGIGDHPRVCGEHDPTSSSTPEVSGSSPRVRGTRLPAEPGGVEPGIIPACAGNTSRTTTERSR